MTSFPLQQIWNSSWLIASLNNRTINPCVIMPLRLLTKDRRERHNNASCVCFNPVCIHRLFTFSPAWVADSLLLPSECWTNTSCQGSSGRRESRFGTRSTERCWSKWRLSGVNFLQRIDAFRTLLFKNEQQSWSHSVLEFYSKSTFTSSKVQ